MVEQVDTELKKISETKNGRGEEDQKIMRLFEKSVNLYQGHFLVDEMEEFWTLSCRERLRNKYLLLIAGIGEYLKKSEQWEKAVEWYQRALEVDYLSEKYYQNLMICYSQLGQLAKVVETYQRCQKALSHAFGISPSPDTEAIIINSKEITRFKG
jgi:two-component SAPR family response regulator